MPTSRRTPPLAGVRVVDFSELAPGPFLTRCLADLGAEVHKVERPTRDGAYGVFRGTYEVLNAGKQIHVLDLKDRRGLAQALALADDADILVDGFRPGVMDRLGLGYEAVAERRPGLVYVSITGYGQTGPLTKEPGHDINYLASSGILALTGGLHQPPDVTIGVPIGDVLSSLYALGATLAAVTQSRETGRGQQLDVAIADCLTHVLSTAIGQFQHQGLTTLEECRTLQFTKPAYGVFATEDGDHITLAANEDHFFKRLVELLDLDLTGLRTADHAERRTCADEINERIAAAVVTYRTDEVVDMLSGADIPVSRIVAPLDVPATRHAVERELFTATGDLAYPRFPVRVGTEG